MKLRSALALCLAALLCTPAMAQPFPQAQPSSCVSDRLGKIVCGPADSFCLQDRLGNVRCSPAGGGIEQNNFGQLLCGPGQCVRNRLGDVHCASSPRAGAGVDMHGNAVCASGCVPGNQDACVVPTPAR